MLFTQLSIAQRYLENANNLRCFAHPTVTAKKRALPLERTVAYDVADLARWTLTNKYSIKSIDIVLSNRFHPLINRLRCTIVLYALVALLILLTAGAHSIASLFLSFPPPLPLFLPLPPRNARLSRHKGNILPSPVQMRGMVR